MEISTTPAMPLELLQRRKLSQAQKENYISHFQKDATYFLENERDTMEAQNLGLSSDVEFLKETSTLSEIKNFKLYEENLKNRLMRTSYVFEDIKLRLNTRFFSPPYELEWTEKSVPFVRSDGKMLTFGSQGFASSGIGISLSSSQKAFATITPSGHYEYSWSSFQNLPTLTSKGGLGVLVYKQGNPSPVLHNNTTLWNMNSPLQFTGETKEGPLSSLYIGDGKPAPMSFASFLVPVSFVMEPGVNYIFWIWTWQINSIPKDSAFLSFLSCHVPVISVNMSDPNYPIVH